VEPNGDDGAVADIARRMMVALSLTVMWTMAVEPLLTVNEYKTALSFIKEHESD
jgi:hypothetical protein